MHLRMTGNLLIREPGADEALADLMETTALGGPRLYEAHPDARHLRARLALDDGSELWFTDPRRFGHGEVLARGRARRLLRLAARGRAARRRADRRRRCSSSPPGGGRR